jgi:hypothetical protein
MKEESIALKMMVEKELVKHWRLSGEWAISVIS